MRLASHIVCPFRFNYKKHPDQIKQVIEEINKNKDKFIKQYSKFALELRQKRKISKRRSSKVFGSILELYIEQKFKPIILHKQHKFYYKDIVGVVDFVTNDSVIEVKYSTLFPIEVLQRNYLLQSLMYAIGLNRSKINLICANPIQDKIEIYTYNINELQKEKMLIDLTINGYSMIRPGIYCINCKIRECPFKQLMNNKFDLVNKSNSSNEEMVDNINPNTIL